VANADAASSKIGVCIIFGLFCCPIAVYCGTAAPPHHTESKLIVTYFSNFYPVLANYHPTCLMLMPLHHDGWLIVAFLAAVSSLFALCDSVNIIVTAASA